MQGIGKAGSGGLMSGAAIKAAYEAELDTNPFTDTDRDAVSLLKSGYTQTPLNDVLEDMRAGNAVKIVTLGDSITAGGYNVPLQAMLRKYYANNTITVINRGFSGSRTDEILAQWPTAVTGENPDLIVLMAGMNDAIQDTAVSTHIASMKSMISLAKTEGRAIVCMNLTPNNYMQELDGTEPQKRIDDYRTAGEELAASIGVPHLDLNQAILNLMGKNGFSWTDLFADRVHPNATGNKEIAGALFCKLLAGEDLTLSIGGKLAPTAANFTYTAGVVSGRNNGLAPMVTKVRLTPVNLTDGASIWFWVDDYAGRCRFVIEATREEVANGKQPRLFVNNDYAVEGAHQLYFKLGKPNTPARYSVAGVPITTVTVKPGMNQIALLPLTGGTAEIGACYISNDATIYENDLSYTEDFGPNTKPYSYLSTNTDNTPKVLSKSLPAIQAAPAGATVKIGQAMAAIDQGSLQRLRLSPSDGFQLLLCQRSQTDKEQEPAFKVTFTQSGANTVVTTSAALVSFDAVTPFIDIEQVTISAMTLDGDKKLDILHHVGNGAAAGDTAFYLNNQLVATLPFTLGNGQMFARNTGTGSTMLNGLNTVTPESGLFAEINGEEWIEFDRQVLVDDVLTTVPARICVFNGTKYGSDLTAV